MAEKIGTRLKHAWDAFNDQEDRNEQRTYAHVPIDYGPGYGIRPDRRRVISGSERTIISSIYTRIAIDVASTTFEHVRTDEQDRYLETINSGLNTCLNVEANVDESAFAFKVDVVISLLDEGCVALVPVDTDKNPYRTSSFDILTLRVGKVVGWHPQYVDLDVYNENVGMVQRITLPKSMVAIIENPFYAVMNEPNSTLKRLVYKLGLLDDADARANSTKLDLIIQLPYTVKTPTQKKRAAERKKDIEMQLTGSSYGIAYIDATEHVTQLNRPVENTLSAQINDLTNQLYGQLGIDATILNGTATPETMNNYYQRTVSPIIQAIKEEMIRKFLTKTARTQHQTIMTFQDPFKYLTVTQIAQVVDTLSRNEVLTGNEFRTALGFKPSDEPSADELRNKNLIDPNADYGSTSADASSVDQTSTEEVDDESTTLGDLPISQL